jgi:hypothetical protein
MRDNKLNIVSASSLFVMKNKDAESINFTELSLHYRLLGLGGRFCGSGEVFLLIYFLTVSLA